VPNGPRGLTKALVLLSGGLDSCVVLAHALAARRSCVALSFDYGQRHRIELKSAKSIAQHYGVPHRILRIDPLLFANGSSTLVNHALPVTAPSLSAYVPCRNLLFLAHAASFAESIESSEIWVGANADDVPTYPDCSPAFFQAFENAATAGSHLGTNGLKIVSPLTHLNKGAIIALGKQLNAPLDLSWSCYDPQDDRPCTVCSACLLRQQAERSLSHG
jgi:7-cyano-7-deazaguanine synthase